MMRRVPRKIHRPRASGELGVEQTQALSAVGAMLEQAGLNPADGINVNGCFLIGYCGAEPGGLVALETQVDAALIRWFFVLGTMRRRGLGAELLRAARVAAHTRGARRLYAVAPPEGHDYLARFGFKQVSADEVARAFVTRPLGCGRVDIQSLHALCLDISRDSLIER